MRKRACILVYNPISNHGHLDSWNAMFVSILLDAGYEVLTLTSNSDDLIFRLNKKSQKNYSSLKILQWQPDIRSISQKITDRLQAIFKRFYKFFYQEKDKKITGKDEEVYFLEPEEFGKRLLLALKPIKTKPDLVFNMYMDMYRTDLKCWKKFEEVNTLPWTGIRFVPRSQPEESYYSLQSLKGMCFLDEYVTQKYKEHFPNKKFSYLPDITDNSLPETSSHLVIEIKQRAQNRKIVFMGGTIGQNKNLAIWYRLIEIANPNKWYFVQIGEIVRGSLLPEDIAAEEKVLKMNPENYFVCTEYIADEAIFNEIISVADVIFAVYRNFKISSNMLGKAANFNKPILVADEYLMGQRVDRYGIGFSVPQNDPDAIYSALNLLTYEVTIPEDRFEAYRRDFSHDVLSKCLLRHCESLISSGENVLGNNWP